MPTHYCLDPVYQVGVPGGSGGDVWNEVLVAAIIWVVPAPLVVDYGRRVERRLAMIV